MNALQSLPEYEIFIYTLPQHNSGIARSTLVVARRGVTAATLNGAFEFHNGLRLIVREMLSFAPTGQIKSYG